VSAGDVFDHAVKAQEAELEGHLALRQVMGLQGRVGGRLSQRLRLEKPVGSVWSGDSALHNAYTCGSSKQKSRGALRVHLRTTVHVFERHPRRARGLRVLTGLGAQAGRRRGLGGSLRSAISHFFAAPVHILASACYQVLGSPR